MYIFDSVLDSLFGLDSNIFNKPTKDMKPYYCKRVKGGYMVVANAVGISKEDLEVKLESPTDYEMPVLSVVGETKIDSIDFSNRVNLKISVGVREKIKSLSYQVKDGLVYILLGTEINAYTSMKANYAEGLDKQHFEKPEDQPTKTD